MEGLQAMIDLYDVKEPEMMRKGFFLKKNHPGTKLSEFSAPNNGTNFNEKAAYAALITAKRLKSSINLDFTEYYGRQVPPKISLRRTPLEGFCPPRDQPICTPASKRYRTHDGTCNNRRKMRWGSAQMPFHRFVSPAYSDGIESLRRSVNGGLLASARFISLLVHGSRESNSQITLILAQWGQLIDHDLTSTAQPRSVNGSVPKCCGVKELHPNCAPIKVPLDDPWLASLGVRCLEFLRSAPVQRRDCILSWREQTNQVTSYLDASPIYSSNARTSDDSRIFRDGLLLYGRGPPREDACLRGAFANQCIRPGDARSGEQPGLLAMHHVWVGEHNRIAIELSELNRHWSDEKVYQETRRIIGAMFQHITYREFLPLVLGKEVCRLFDLDLLTDGYYTSYDVRVNPGIANAFSAAAFRFGHSLIQGSYMRADRNHQILNNNVTLHDEFSRGDIGTTGSLHRLLRGLAMQRAQKRDEFITAELTNHLFQSGSFPFGLDLAAINIQRGRDHGLPAYTQWREPCGLSPIQDWDDLETIIGTKSRERIERGYRHVDDIDLFVGGLAERPVVGGLVGPTFACIIAQQFSNIRKGDRFWYENAGFESSFTPAQLQSLRQTSFAQVLCRSLGGGTLQKHVFLPHTLPSNERQPCGLGYLAKIDLIPWIERDPFDENDRPNINDLIPPGTQNRDKHSKRPSAIVIPINDQPIVVDKVDFTPNGGIGIQKPLLLQLDEEELIVVNQTTVNNKLDLPTNTKTNQINNKLTRPKRKKKLTKRRSSTSTTTTTTTTVIPPTTKQTITRRRTRTTPKHRTLNDRLQMTTVTTPTTTVKRKQKRRPKRDTETGADEQKARGTILVNFDQLANQSPINNNNQQVHIETPDKNNYKIEINIRPNSNINHLMTTTQPIESTLSPFPIHELIENNDSIIVNSPITFKRPNINSGSGGGAVKYTLNRPLYNVFTRLKHTTKKPTRINVKRPTSNFYDNSQSDIEQNYYHGTITELTNRPQYNDFITEKPNYPNNYLDDLQPTVNYGLNTRRPTFDNYEPMRPQNNYQPNVHQTTTQFYDNYGNTGGNPQNDIRPRPDWTNFYNNEEDDTIRPTYNSITKKPQYSLYNRRPTFTTTSVYDSNDADDVDLQFHRPTYSSFGADLPSQSLRPTQSYSNRPPLNFDDALTNRPIHHSTPFSYGSKPGTSNDYEYQTVTNNYNSRPQYNKISSGNTFINQENNNVKPNILYLNPTNNWERQTPNGDLLTFYSVGTTQKSTTPKLSDYFNSKLNVQSPVTNKIDYSFAKSLTTTTRNPTFIRPHSISNNNFEIFQTKLKNIHEAIKTITSKTDPKPTTNDNNKKQFKNITKPYSDYDATTYTPSNYNYDYNIDDEITYTTDKQNSFDNDGYLRPEHMNYDLLEHKTNIDNPTIIDYDKIEQLFKDSDDYILPSLYNITYLKNLPLEETVENVKRIKRSDSQTDGKTLTIANENEMRSKKPTLISLVPFEVLTKPERPDNWVIFDIQKGIKPLPSVPDSEANDNGQEGAIDEYPRPMNNIFLRNRISIINNKPHNNK